MAVLPPGSYLALSCLTADLAPGPVNTAVGVYHAQGLPCVARPHAATLRFFDGLEIVDPGLTPTHLWRPDDLAPSPEAIAGGNIIYGAVARKP